MTIAPCSYHAHRVHLHVLPCLPQRLTSGDDVEVLHDDGWWEMTFVGSRPAAGGTEYCTRSELYQIERWVAADAIRPRWRRWGTKWRSLEQLAKKPATSPKSAAAKPASKAAAAAATASKPSSAPKAASAKAASPEAAPAQAKGAPQRRASEVGGASSKPAGAPPSLPTAGAPHSLPALSRPAADASQPAASASGAPSAGDELVGRKEPGEGGGAGGASLPTAPSLPSAMDAASLERCTAVLKAMEARDDAVWFAQPVSASGSVHDAARPMWRERSALALPWRAPGEPGGGVGPTLTLTPTLTPTR